MHRPIYGSLRAGTVLTFPLGLFALPKYHDADSRSRAKPRLPSVGTQSRLAITITTIRNVHLVRRDASLVNRFLPDARSLNAVPSRVNLAIEQVGVKNQQRAGRGGGEDAAF